MQLKVGELAKRAGLTVRTLHHYDEIGLLTPSGRSERGYRLYNRDDIERLVRRASGRPRAEAVAAEAISWGDPVLASAISTVAGGRLWYRGRDAATLAETDTLEEVADLLWGGFPESPTVVQVAEPGIPAAMHALVARAADGPPGIFRYPSALRADAVAVLADLASALAGPGMASAPRRPPRC